MNSAFHIQTTMMSNEPPHTMPTTQKTHDGIVAKNVCIAHPSSEIVCGVAARTPSCSRALLPKRLLIAAVLADLHITFRFIGANPIELPKGILFLPTAKGIDVTHDSIDDHSDPYGLLPLPHYFTSFRYDALLNTRRSIKKDDNIFFRSCQIVKKNTGWRLATAKH